MQLRTALLPFVIFYSYPLYIPYLAIDFTNIMTTVQLEYVVAVDTHRSFVTAAEKCFVTQPTLSMQIQKLEDELSVKIFDRSKLPVVPTEIGSAIIAQARIILKENARIREIIADRKRKCRAPSK